MKALARILLALHCLLALSMPAHALAGTFDRATRHHQPMTATEECHGASLVSPHPADTGDQQLPAGSLAPHGSCQDCLICSSGCLPASLSSRTLALPDLLEQLVAHHPVLPIGLVPAPELKPPRH